MKNKKRIKEVFEFLMNSFSLTQREVAKELGIDNSLLSRVLKGDEKVINKKYLIALIKIIEDREQIIFPPYFYRKVLEDKEFFEKIKENKQPIKSLKRFLTLEEIYQEKLEIEFYKGVWYVYLPDFFHIKYHFSVQESGKVTFYQNNRFVSRGDLIRLSPNFLGFHFVKEDNTPLLITWRETQKEKIFPIRYISTGNFTNEDEVGVGIMISKSWNTKRIEEKIKETLKSHKGCYFVRLTEIKRIIPGIIKEIEEN